MKLKLPERRRFVRLDAPLEIVLHRGEVREKFNTKNISPGGFMFEAKESLNRDEVYSFSVKASSNDPPVKIRGRVIWQNKKSLEDGSPFDVGVDIVGIEDSGKNQLLKYLCDLLYGSEYKERT